MVSLPSLQINSIDDDHLVQQVVKRGLVGLSSVIIFLSCAAIWSIYLLTEFYQNEVQLIAEQESLLHVMRVSGRERIVLMYSMASEEDSFKRDNQRMTFYSEGSKFALARIKFIGSALAKNERDLVENESILTNATRPIQEQIVDLLTKGDDKLALKLLKEHVIPDQKKLLQTLDKLHSSVEQRNEKIKQKAAFMGNASIIMLISIVIVLILGAIFIIRKTTHRAFKLISQLTEARKTLQRTNSELIQQKDTLDHHAIVSIADKKGNITYVNDKFCEVSGYSREELIGKNHRVLKSDIHPDEFYQDLWNTIKHGNVWHGELCNQCKDGSYYWVESTISPFLNSKGKPYQYVSIRTDITHLLEAKIEAEKANQAKSTFLSSMSHELRTPMNAVLGFAHILESELEGDQLDSAHEISQAGNHLMELINEILDLSRIEIGHVEVSLEEVDIEALINECLKMVVNIAQSKNIKLQQHVKISSDIRLMADRMRLKQALINYLSNAIKFNRMDGEVIVSINSVGTNKCRILVEDTGPGLNEEQCTKIFNSFTKSDENTNLIEGSGIGLTITKRLIEMMNGKVGVESEVGKGSTFWIELPTA